MKTALEYRAERDALKTALKDARGRASKWRAILHGFATHVQAQATDIIAQVLQDGIGDDENREMRHAVADIIHNDALVAQARIRPDEAREILAGYKYVGGDMPPRFRPGYQRCAECRCLAVVGAETCANCGSMLWETLDEDEGGDD